jgi:hypothetical protein
MALRFGRPHDKVLPRDHALRGLPEIGVLEPPALRAQVIAILDRARRVYTLQT